MDLKIIIEQLTVLFFLMAIGFLINKLGILNKEYNKCISFVGMLSMEKSPKTPCFKRGDK